MNRRYFAMFKHDVILAKKTLILSAVGYISMLILSVLVFMSAKYGNLAKNAAKDDVMPIFRSMMIFIGISASMIPMLCFDNNTLISDIKCGWQKFTYTSPLSVNEQLRYRYGLKIAGLLLSHVFSAIQIGTIVMADGKWLTKTDALITVFIYGYLYIMEMISIPLYIKFKNSDKAGMASMLLIMVLMIPVVFLFKDKGDKLKEISEVNGGVIRFDEMVDLLGIDLPLIAAATAVLMVVSHIVSYMCTKKLLEKKVC